MPPEPELIPLNAITAAHASTEVRRQTVELSRVARRFIIAVDRLQSERAARSPNVMEAWESVEAERNAFRGLLDELVERINGELGR